jgi:hypothetical protein
VLSLQKIGIGKDISILCYSAEDRNQSGKYVILEGLQLAPVVNLRASNGTRKRGIHPSLQIVQDELPKVFQMVQINLQPHSNLSPTFNNQDRSNSKFVSKVW